MAALTAPPAPADNNPDAAAALAVAGHDALSLLTPHGPVMAYIAHADTNAWPIFVDTASGHSDDERAARAFHAEAHEARWEGLASDALASLGVYAANAIGDVALATHPELMARHRAALQLCALGSGCEHAWAAARANFQHELSDVVRGCAAAAATTSTAPTLTF